MYPEPPRASARPGPRRSGRRPAFWLLLACAATLISCGYRMETVGLPGGARNLHLDVIRNRTFTAEVDVRLHSELRRLLYRDAGIRVSPREESELTLEIILIRFHVDRARSLQATNVTSVSYTLAGHISLLETGTGRVLIDQQPIQTTTRLDFDQARVETPAVRDEGLNDAVAAFAEEVMSRLLNRF